MTTDLEKEREAIKQIIIDHLTAVYICNRVWDAWYVGTMSQDDFEPAQETDLPDDLADALMARAALAAPAAPQEPEVEPCPRCGGSGTITVLSDSSPDAHNVDVDCDQCHGTGSAADAAKHLAVDLAFEKQRHMKLWGEFRNFLRSLCDRFGYSHDPIDFRRDLVSLEEAIAAKIAAPQEQPSDEEISQLWNSVQWRNIGEGHAVHRFARALLSRYGATPQGGEHTREAKEAAQRARLKERFKNRPQTPATADFDLPAPNDPPQPAGRDAPAVPKGWKFRVTHEDDRTWLAITTPHGSCAALSTARKDGNGNEPIASQVLSYLGDALTTQGD